MKILYMNQGGRGEWGAVRYLDFDILLLAEWQAAKEGFDVNWCSGDSLPTMSVQLRSDLDRPISAVRDVDITAKTVRPIVTFTTTQKSNVGIRVVFMHLKSGSEPLATDALKLAVTGVIKREAEEPKPRPILWIGDFNRAAEDVIPGATPLWIGGGHSWWPLDRAYVTGDWSGLRREVSVVTFAPFDHNHTGLGVEITPM